MAHSESIHIKMDPDFKAKVDQYCEDRNMTMSEAVRAALRDSLTIAGYYDKPDVNRHGSLN